ncbi:zinc ABC transporter substrate-binding protein [bacterium]|nr:zinc ABC transporter substrate-binding protein [bacterium]
MKRSIMGCLALAIAGIGISCTNSHAPPKDGRVHVLCSFFPMYIFTKNVVGDVKDTSVEMMLPAQAGCPHDYDLTPEDVKKIAKADLYIMNGDGLESFGEKQVKAANSKVEIVDTSAGVEHFHHGEGAEEHDHDHAHEGKKDADHEHDHENEGHDHAHDDHDHKHEAHEHDHDHGHDHGHSHEGGINPHFFSSPKRAATQVQNICNALVKADPKHAQAYQENAAAYIAKLNALDKEFQEASKKFRRSEIVTMHEVFDYLAADCGLKIAGSIYSAPGVEPSSAEIRQLVQKIKDSKAAAVFTEPQYPSRLGETIGKETGIPVETLDPVASGPVDPPNDYYEKKMHENLDTLSRVLKRPE